MDSVTYAIVFNGDLVDGFELDSVKSQLTKLLHADPSKIEKLFSGKNVVIKRTANKDEAIKYGTVLRRAGADVKVKVIKPAQSPPHKKERALDLAPNQGYLFDAMPPAEDPHLDLSEYSLAANDGTPLIPEKHYERADINLAALSVAENDGRPLAEPKQVIEKVIAPNFGLDVVGATLETLKETVELLNPDTSALSIAATGADILSETDKHQGPEPIQPDTSKISLLVNHK